MPTETAIKQTIEKSQAFSDAYAHLSEKQKEFFAVWSGSPIEVSRKTGLSEIYCRKAAHAKRVLAAVKAYEAANLTQVASPDAILAFYTQVMQDTEVGLTERLRAAEMLSKYHGMFTERREVIQQLQITVDTGLPPGRIGQAKTIEANRLMSEGQGAGLPEWSEHASTSPNSNGGAILLDEVDKPMDEGE